MLFALVWLMVCFAFATGCAALGHHSKKVTYDRVAFVFFSVGCMPALWIILPLIAHALQISTHRK